MAWRSTGDEVSHNDRCLGCVAQMRWKVASTELNVVGSSPSGEVATVCSSSVAIRSVASSCRKKVVGPDEVLRFVVPGSRLMVPDAAATDGPLSRPSG
jgi:hypothetical protein